MSFRKRINDVKTLKLKEYTSKYFYDQCIEDNLIEINYQNENEESYNYSDQSMDYNSNPPTNHSSHRMFDLHGYTINGAKSALRRVFTSVDRSRQQVIKVNVGQGSHSKDGIAKLPDVVKEVANSLQLPPPITHDKNPGYLLMILPPIMSAD